MKRASRRWRFFYKIHIFNRFLKLHIAIFFFAWTSAVIWKRTSNLAHVWFKQDGATTDTAQISLDVLRREFPERLIFRNGDMWSPPPYFLIWECLWFFSCAGLSKITNVYQQAYYPTKLKDAIQQDIIVITQEMLINMWCFRELLEMCILEEGHVVIFRTRMRVLAQNFDFSFTMSTSKIYISYLHVPITFIVLNFWK